MLGCVREKRMFWFYCCGDHRDLHRVDRRQRQMCIRDRFLRAAERGAHLGVLTRGLLQLLASHGAAAVSYTHLRAHETVLDLVCRLLPEKKH